MLNLCDDKHLLYIDSESEKYTVTGEKAEITVVNSVNSTLFLNLETVKEFELNVLVKADTNLTVLLWNNGNEVLNSNEYFEVEENATLTLAYGDMNYCDNKRDIVVDLIGAESRAYVKSAILCKNNKHYDLKVNSKAINTYGEMENYCVVLDQGKFYLDAVGKIEKGCHGSKSHQTSRALCFNGKQQATIIPELLIDDNDVEASHATTVGSIDPQQLFYMQSRGLTQNEALGLITLGYLSFITQVVDDTDINKYLHREIESKVSSL